MQILVEHKGLPQTGELTLRFDYTARINVSAEEAQKKVSRHVAWKIGNLLFGESPVLALLDVTPGNGPARIVWRVPVALAYPSYGRIGVVGTIDVDAQTGEPDVQPDLITEIKRNGKTLTQGIP